MELSKNHSLQKLNTFGLNVVAKFYTEVSSLQQAISIFKFGELNHDKKLILGGGSNILFSEDYYDGVVLKNNIQGIHVVKEDDQHFWVKAGGGVQWQELVESCLRANFGGIENLSLIPGTS
jgi:UDP-N-acetylmuramate dehydrogenase